MVLTALPAALVTRDDAIGPGSLIQSARSPAEVVAEGKCPHSRRVRAGGTCQQVRYPAKGHCTLIYLFRAWGECLFTCY